ncbi:2-C-methyl-D-erythritol 4-phosphate cytidylyltransferase [candidate division TA06 bacterium]|nr:2-C-methyl-D-erythritol 4-phosphate cytidylyltransferase [candidate division TA06 bacterium]
MTSAIIVAAGSGKRVGGELEKQFLPLCGFPLLKHCLQVFEDCDRIDQILLVLSEERIEFCKREVLNKFGIKKVLEPIPGGKRRQDSVFQGLNKVEGGIVLIHDGVRPLLQSELLMRVIRECETHQAVVPVIEIGDTLKKVDGGFVAATLNRTTIKGAQTPQAFEYSLIRQAYDKAYEEGFYATDDASLVERLGVKVKVIEGSPENIKITTKSDLLFAESILKRRLSE